MHRETARFARLVDIVDGLPGGVHAEESDRVCRIVLQRRRQLERDGVKEWKRLTQSVGLALAEYRRRSDRLGIRRVIGGLDRVGGGQVHHRFLQQLARTHAFHEDQFAVGRQQTDSSPLAVHLAVKGPRVVVHDAAVFHFVPSLVFFLFHEFVARLSCVRQKLIAHVSARLQCDGDHVGRQAQTCRTSGPSAGWSAPVSTACGALPGLGRLASLLCFLGLQFPQLCPLRSQGLGGRHQFNA